MEGDSHVYVSNALTKEEILQSGQFWVNAPCCGQRICTLLESVKTQFSSEFSLVTVFICLFEVGEFAQTPAKQSGIVVSLDHSARVTFGAFIACWKLITELYFSF